MVVSSNSHVADAVYRPGYNACGIDITGREPGEATVTVEGTAAGAPLSAQIKVIVYPADVLKLWRKDRAPEGVHDLELAFPYVNAYYKGYMGRSDGGHALGQLYTLGTPRLAGLPESDCPWYAMGSALVADDEGGWAALHERHTCFALRNPDPSRRVVKDPARFDLVFWDNSEEDDFAVYRPIAGGAYKALGLVVVYLDAVVDERSFPVPPPFSLMPDTNTNDGIYYWFHDLPRTGVVHQDYLVHGELGPVLAATHREGARDDFDWGQFRDILAPCWEDPQTLYLSAGALACTASAEPDGSYEALPWETDAVLAVRVCSLARPRESYSIPELMSFDPPPEIGPPIVTYAALVPFTAFAGTRVIHSNQWMRQYSPFVRAERVSNFRCIEHVANRTSEIQHGVEIETKSGVTPAQTTEISEACGLGVTPNHGLEAGWGYAAAARAATTTLDLLAAARKASASLSLALGYKAPTGINELVETTRRFQLNVPPQTAVAFYQRDDKIRITTSDPGGMGTVLGVIGYGGLDNYAYSQYPHPDDMPSDSIVADVPSGVQLLTPWGEMIR